MKSVALLIIASMFAVGSLSAQGLEQKGSFGIVVAENFVKFNYVITYLGDSAQPDQIAFRISFDDTKGYNLAAEIDESQTNVKNLKNQSLTGKVNRENSGSAILLFPKADSFSFKGKIKLYTVVKGYKLNKNFDL